MSIINKYLPLIAALKAYNRASLKGDFAAGLTVAIILIPQAIAYAYLAGMPPIYGLYAGVFPLFVYALMGTSRQLSVGPVAITSVLLLSGVSTLAEPFSDEYIQLVIFTGLLVGIVQVLFGVLKLGFIINFLSRPVLAGFISAAAVIIIIAQLKEALGLATPGFKHIYETLWYAISHLIQTKPIALVITLISLIVLYFFRRWNLLFIGTFLIVGLSAVSVYMLGLDSRGLTVIGEVPSGLPSFRSPVWTWTELVRLVPTILTVSLMSIIECMSIAKSLEQKSKTQALRANQEFIAIGMAKIIGSFFQALPSSGSFSRSAINSNAGAQSQLSSVITIIILVFSLLFLTPLFYYIPKAVLSAIIIFSVFKLVDIDEAKFLWRVKRMDFILMLVTFMATLIMGIESGVLIGVVLSFMMILYQSSKPVMVELGNIPGTTHYRNIERFSRAIRLEDYLILRFDNQLFFGNANNFKEQLFDFLSSRSPLPKCLILDASNMFDIDSTGLQILQEVREQLHNQKVQLVISGALGNIRDLFKLSGFTNELGEKNHFMHIRNAIKYLENGERGNDQYAIQSNY